MAEEVGDAVGVAVGDGVGDRVGEGFDLLAAEIHGLCDAEPGSKVPARTSVSAAARTVLVTLSPSTGSSEPCV